MIDFWTIFILPILSYSDTPWRLDRLDEPLEIAPHATLRWHTITEILISIFSDFLEFYFSSLSLHWAWVGFCWYICISRSCFLILFDICDLGYNSIRWSKWKWPLVHTNRIIYRSTRCIDEVTVELGYLRFLLDCSIIQEWSNEHLCLTISSTVREPDRLIVANYPF